MTGKKAVLFVTIAFLLPVLAAKLVLEMGWYNKGVTNSGELLSGQTQTEWLQHQGQWRLIYTLPDNCDEQCESALFQLNQIPVAVGRERERVASILLVPENRADDEPAQPEVTEQTIDAAQLQTLSALPHAGEAIYLVDPLNNLILAYPIPHSKDAQISQSKGLLKDLRKLMKLSKVG
ncbi:hypothetical protein LRP49_12635 [Enterovibrio sp. ZSDZ35]|uniref:Cytochrome oxidase n=1 Tax=Enterovibrio qingdaonensis TaxID=2899818 RepID=A0ABT5QM01_9GAMM|nr:hypothetical protein [Enterovibrio sp. ZSDZ35]MDD1782018.1 hypothetical protein [Enterovibrio sp. ZSDZ35]